ncbi:MAG: sigma-54-dependent Fis family transcriptional regulator [Candidatus Marinimicrobia bacterium]|nr:sigma-54-dependent Fis family transcriptional regulator [Candidatus Neomarinimicrobiota bacterium]
MEASLYPKYPILIADDVLDIVLTTEAVLQFNNITNTITTTDSREVMGILNDTKVSAVILDLVMPHVSGKDLLRQINLKYPEIPVVIVTGMNDMENVVECIKLGAYDYLIKPVENTRLINVVERAVKLSDMSKEISFYNNEPEHDRLENPDNFANIITKNKDMLSLFSYAEAIAASNQPVLITGESGTGKGEIARAIHMCGSRTGNMVSVAIAGLDDTMFSDTLFGHKKGAFTGALNDREGLVRKAEGGTLFLDEIGDLEFQSQVKLLQLIQEREYLPLGTDNPEKANVRIICATNVNIRKSEKFRKDLYHRLNTHHIHLTPLKERKEDIPLLLEHFLAQAAKEMNKKVPNYPPELISLLNNYDFPGNIRELRAIVYDAMAEHKSKTLSMKTFLKKIGAGQDYSPKELRDQQVDLSKWEVLPKMEDLKALLVEEAHRRTGGNQSLAAKLIDVSRSTFIKYLKQ